VAAVDFPDPLGPAIIIAWGGVGTTDRCTVILVNSPAFLQNNMLNTNKFNMISAAITLLVLGEVKTARDVTNLPFPTGKVSGKLFGLPFMPTKVLIKPLSNASCKINGKVVDSAPTYALKFRTGKEFFADQEVSVWFTIDAKDKLSNLVLKRKPFKFTDPKNDSFVWKGKTRNIGMGPTTIFITQDKPTSKSSSDMNMFSVRIVFGVQKGQTIPGKILLESTDRKAILAGTFTAQFEKY
jgi:hypothetical protein